MNLGITPFDNELLDYGVLGVILLMVIGALIYLFINYNKEKNLRIQFLEKMVQEDKEAYKIISNQYSEHTAQMIKIMEQQTMIHKENTAILLGEIREVPAKTDILIRSNLGHTNPNS